MAGAQEAAPGAPDPGLRAAVTEPMPTPPVPPLTPDQASFRAALLAEITGFDAAERTAIEEFYAARGYAPFWGDGAANLGALRAALDTGVAQALPIQRYDAEGLARLFAPGSAAPAAGPSAAREVAATRPTCATRAT